MIRWENSRTGHRIPIINGLNLCSLVDPIKEAEKWILSYKDILQDFDHFFVIGLAGGFHIDCLLKNSPKTYITVIESCTELVRESSEIIKSWNDRVTIFVKPSLGQIKAYESFHSIFDQGSYCVLSYPASIQLDRDYYNQIEQFILGRSQEGFKYQSEVLARKNPYFESFFQKYGLTGRESIKDIVTKISNVDSLTEEDLMWLSLGELIH